MLLSFAQLGNLLLEFSHQLIFVVYHILDRVFVRKKHPLMLACLLDKFVTIIGQSLDLRPLLIVFIVQSFHCLHV